MGLYLLVYHRVYNKSTEEFQDYFGPEVIVMVHCRSVPIK